MIFMNRMVMGTQLVQRECNTPGRFQLAFDAVCPAFRCKRRGDHFCIALPGTRNGVAMICPQCEAENAFAATNCARCGKRFGPSRDGSVEPDPSAKVLAPASRVTRPDRLASPGDVLGRPENLDWLGRYALWGMPLTYVGLVTASAFGLKLPMLVLKVLIGGGALWPLRALLKREPGNARALAARKFGRIQMGVMLAAELATVPIMFVLPAESWLAIGGVFLIVAFVVHLAVGVIGTRRLRGVAKVVA